MARPRTPLAVARAIGRAARDPKRFRDRKEPAKSLPLGDPTSFLGPIEMAVWDAFKRELYWLKESDRACVECACILRARLWTTGDLKVIGPLMQFLRAMGGTPADRTRISIPDEGDYDPLFDDDPADAYVN